LKTKLLITICIAVAILVGFFALESTAAEIICRERGGVPSGDVCIFEDPIETTTEDNKSEAIPIDEISFMEPNTMEFFYYPNPEDIENRDVFQKFILIRLPESLGGDVDDVSAFRAYSAVSLSDHCVVKYWPEEGRQRMENPCRGDLYRAIDGLLTINADPIMITSPVALPQLTLSVDSSGFLYVEPPKWIPQENGVVSIGREISMQEIRQGSEIIANSLQKSRPNYPKIPSDFAGHLLAEINPGNKVEARYFDFSSMSGHIFFTIEHESAQIQQTFPNLEDSNSEFWKIGETIVKIGGSALDKTNEQPDQYKSYEIEFVKDGFKFTIEGKNLEFMKKEIMANYFPEHEYDDLFLISRSK
jgi:hypothetical protein